MGDSLGATGAEVLIGTPRRWASVDALRDCKLLVNDPGDWAHVYAPLEHSAWNGCIPTDLIFPFFLFVVAARRCDGSAPALSQALTPRPA